MKNVNFSEALEALKQGKEVKRSIWSDDAYLVISTSDFRSPNPIIDSLVLGEGTMSPRKKDLLAVVDIFSNDWVILWYPIFSVADGKVFHDKYTLDKEEYLLNLAYLRSIKNS